MSWVTEKKAKEAIEKQRNYGVTGNYKKRFQFTLEQEQWIAPGYGYNNKIKGVLDCGLFRTNSVTNTQTWSIEMRDLEFDWNPRALPESYFLFAYPYRMDVEIDKSGKITKGSTWINYAEGWRKKYKDEIFRRMSNPERADTFYHSFCGNPNHTLAVKLLKNNPLLIAFGNVIALNYKLNNEPEPKGEFGERYSSDLIKTDYFGEDIPLPLKTTWLEKETGDEKMEEWIRLGGLQKEKYPEEDFRRMLRQVTGIFNLEVPVHVDFSEFYRLSQPWKGFRQILCCGAHTQTLIKDVWIKNEDLEMNEDEKGVVYG